MIAYPDPEGEGVREGEGEGAKTCTRARLYPEGKTWFYFLFI
jgi:hypothetical protein